MTEQDERNHLEEPLSLEASDDPEEQIPLEDDLPYTETDDRDEDEGDTPEDETEDLRELQATLQREHDLLNDSTSSGWVGLEHIQIPPSWRLFIGLSVLLMLVPIWWSYHFNLKIKEVGQLEQRLENVRRRQLFMNAEVVRLERISSVEDRIQALGLDLEHSEVPPTKIEVPTLKDIH